MKMSTMVRPRSTWVTLIPKTAFPSPKTTCCMLRHQHPSHLSFLFFLVILCGFRDPDWLIPLDVKKTWYIRIILEFSKNVKSLSQSEQNNDRLLFIISAWTRTFTHFRDPWNTKNLIDGRGISVANCSRMTNKIYSSKSDVTVFSGGVHSPSQET